MIGSIFVILSRFYSALGMAISPWKSIFLYLCFDHWIKQQIAQLFPYKMEPLDVGFKYLRYFLKPNCYKKEDQVWLRKNIEKHICNWTLIYIYLGGKLILDNPVIERTLVYWFSLTKIPVLVINNIRQRLLQLLWTGNLGSKKFHISSQESLSLPKKMGG